MFSLRFKKWNFYTRPRWVDISECQAFHCCFNLPVLCVLTPRWLSVAFIGTLFDRLIVCPDVIAYGHYWSELKRCDVSLTYAIYWPDCNTKCYMRWYLHVCVLSRQHESRLFSRNRAHRCIDAKELLFISTNGPLVDERPPYIFRSTQYIHIWYHHNFSVITVPITLKYFKPWPY